MQKRQRSPHTPYVVAVCRQDKQLFDVMRPDSCIGQECQREREREWRSRLREAVLAWFMPSSPLSHSTVHPVVKKHSLHSEKCGRAFVWSFQTTPFPMIRNRTATPARDGGSR